MPFKLCGIALAVLAISANAAPTKKKALTDMYDVDFTTDANGGCKSWEGDIQRAYLEARDLLDAGGNNALSLQVNKAPSRFRKDRYAAWMKVLQPFQALFGPTKDNLPMVAMQSVATWGAVKDAHQVLGSHKNGPILHLRCSDAFVTYKPPTWPDPRHLDAGSGSDSDSLRGLPSSRGSHGSHDSHDSRGLPGPHGSHDSHDSHTSHDSDRPDDQYHSHDPSDSQESHDSNNPQGPGTIGVPNSGDQAFPEGAWYAENVDRISALFWTPGSNKDSSHPLCDPVANRMTTSFKFDDANDKEHAVLVFCPAALAGAHVSLNAITRQITKGYPLDNFGKTLAINWLKEMLRYIRDYEDTPLDQMSWADSVKVAQKDPAIASKSPWNYVMFATATREDGWFWGKTGIASTQPDKTS